MQYVAFDLGNVLIDVDFEPFWVAAEKVGISRHYIQYIVDFWQNAEMCGLVNYSDIFIKEFNDLEPHDLKFVTEAWNSAIKVNDQMSNFVECLKHEGFKIAYLSNMGPTHKNFLRARDSRFLELADVLHISCDVGVIKPSLLYFQSFLMQHDEFAGCMFLDDRPENIIVASKCKFDSLRFELDSFKDKPPSVLKKELNNIRDRLLRGC